MTRLSYNISDYVGKQFNELMVLDYDTDDMFTCMCTCGKQIHVHVSALRDNKIYSCGCKDKTNINKIIDLTNRQFGELTVLEYVGNRYWRCQCSCGKIISTLGKYLTNGTKTSCGCTKGNIDISLGSKIGNWEVIEKRPNYKYLCRCSCGKEQEVLKYRLLDGSSTSCGHLNHNFIDLTNKVFGEWQVVKYNDNGEWLCKCQKGHTKVIKGEYLRHGEATKCPDCKTSLIDLSNKQFGELQVIKYIGKKTWECKCSCGKTLNVLGANLRNGSTQSCGHILTNKMQATSIIKRSEAQLLAVQSRDNIIAFIGNNRPTLLDLSKQLGLTYGSTVALVRRFNIQNLITPETNTSYMEDELLAYIKEVAGENTEIVQSCKYVIPPKELDIYIPSKNIAIEFNGSYWHSTVFKNKYYHQQKTIECFKKNIHLIHVFEYEWKDEVTKEKIKNYIKLLLSKDTTVVYGRNTVVREIDNSVASRFCNKYHLQNSVNSNISLGLLSNNELLGVMTIGFPRFNSNYEYEIHRMCFKENTTIVGGAEKLFKYFIENYNPHSVLTYVDLSKFTGLSYLRLGFNKVHNDFVTEPNYCWVSLDDKQVVVPRYKTQKHMLVENGLGDESQTEVEIMESLHFTQVFDCGNLKLEWKSNKQ